MKEGDFPPARLKSRRRDSLSAISSGEVAGPNIRPAPTPGWASIALLAWRNEHKETYVFVRDALGNVVQADANSFLHAGDSRTEAESKGFVRGWVFDAYTWTPLDVEGRLKRPSVSPRL